MTSNHLQVGLHETEDSVATLTTVQLQFGSLIPACVIEHAVTEMKKQMIKQNPTHKKIWPHLSNFR